jgi:hypothetical protein
MAHQASDQGGSKSVVSWSEVVSSCGTGIPLGPLLPGCVWPRADENMLLDWGSVVRYAREQEKTRFFINVATVLSLSAHLAGHTGLFGVRATITRPSAGPNIPEMATPEH